MVVVSGVEGTRTRSGWCRELDEAVQLCECRDDAHQSKCPGVVGQASLWDCRYLLGVPCTLRD